MEDPSVLKCPECGNPDVDCNGHSERYGVDIQRYKCKSCGCHFSDEDDLARAKQAKIVYLTSNNLNVLADNTVTCQVCEIGDSKNLATETHQQKMFRKCKNKTEQTLT
jgi:transposase-like protein